MKLIFNPDGRETTFRKQDYRPIDYADLQNNLELPIKICVKISNHGIVQGRRYLFVEDNIRKQQIAIRLSGDAEALADSLDNRNICIYGFIAGEKGKYRMFINHRTLIEAQ